MPLYTTITIIYNPNATHSGKGLATDLQQKLAELKVLPKARLIPTEYAGHAEKLAYELATQTKQALVISASGDGGYHEVVNGLVKAQTEGATPIACLLPAGNANDHYRSLHEGNETDVAKSIAQGNIHTIDLLKLTTPEWPSQDKPYIRYAHSYIGLGLTPQAGKALNKTRINWLNQMFIAADALLNTRPTTIKVKGRERTYDSLSFSNVKRMARVLTISKQSHFKDGKFGITVIPHRNTFTRLRTLMHATLTGVHGKLVTNYSFETTQKTAVQLDGEIKEMPENTHVEISIAHLHLRCVI